MTNRGMLTTGTGTSRTVGYTWQLDDGDGVLSFNKLVAKTFRYKKYLNKLRRKMSLL